MVRVPAVTRDSIPDDQKAVFDQVVQERGGIPTGVPARYCSMHLRSPKGCWG